MVIATDIMDKLATDERCRVLARGLLQLSRQELSRLLEVLVNDPEQVVVDTVNYDVATDSWCPLAVGLGVPEIAQSRGGVHSNAEAKQLILNVGRMQHGQFSLNPISGIAGGFFQHDRHADLTALVHYLLENYEITQQRYGNKVLHLSF
jgi:hypothetical protein